MAPGVGSYDFAVDPDNLNSTYGLIYRRVPAQAEVLDIGCASGNLALALEKGKGCRVLGIDLDPDATAAAAAKGIEAIAADVTARPLDEIVSGRSFDVAILADILEHLATPAGLLAQVRRVLRPGGVVLVSFPNITHIDVQLMLAQGEWRYVPAGILDETHLRFFTLASFAEMAFASGYTVAGSDQVLVGPLGTEVLDSGRLLRLQPSEMSSLVELNRFNPDATVYQHVVELHPSAELEIAGPREVESSLSSATPPTGTKPHLDVIVRTIEGRLAYLKEALYSLVGVIGADVHAIVVVHGRSPSHLGQVEELTTHYRGLLTATTVTNPQAGMGFRGVPLNAGLALVDGEYVAFLDDDDVLYPTFAQRLVGCLEGDPSLTVAYGISQVVKGDATDDGFRPTSHSKQYDDPFDRARLFLENYIPINAYVVRVADLRRAEIRFDETLTVYEDWAFLCRLAAQFRFAHVGHVVSEYRMRSDDSNATSSASQQEWASARAAVAQRLAGQPVRITADELGQLAARDHGLVAARKEADAYRAQLERVLVSRSWRLTRPLRRLLRSQLPE
jgi:methionine biosynthesis protein MetW